MTLFDAKKENKNGGNLILDHFFVTYYRQSQQHKSLKQGLQNQMCCGATKLALMGEQVGLKTSGNGGESGKLGSEAL